MNVNLAILAASLMALIFNFQDELVPIFASAPSHDVGLLSQSPLAFPR